MNIRKILQIVDSPKNKKELVFAQRWFGYIGIGCEGIVIYTLVYMWVFGISLWFVLFLIIALVWGVLGHILSQVASIEYHIRTNKINRE